MITTVTEHYHDVPQVVNIAVAGVNIGKETPVTFDLSYMSRMFVNWHALTWLGFGAAFGITVVLALWTPIGKRIVSASGWFLIVFGVIVLAGTFVLKGYLGLDGLGSLSSIQVANLFAGPVFVELGSWLTREEPH